jgi:predicted regulator of Ras-like GTPase activity (Roadblock/LC7/MglB family)
MRDARETVARRRGDAMTNAFGTVLETLTRQRGVRASLIVSETDGLIIDATLRVGEDGDRVAALAASLYRKARLSAAAARLGEVAFLQLDAERGRICAVGGQNDLVLMVVAEPAANVGLIRVELLKALEMLT